jgi:hypothetical protein
MERRILVVMIVIAVVIAAMLAWLTLSNFHHWGRNAGSEQPLATETRSVEAFHKLVVNGAAEVTLVQGGAPSVSIEAERDARVTSKVANGVLTLDTHDAQHGIARFFHRSTRTRAHVTVTFAQLDTLEFSGAVKVHSSGLTAPSLHVDISGAGSLAFDHLSTDDLSIEGAGTVKATMAGRATRQRVDISGAGNYQAAELASETAKVEVSGAGNVVVNASKSLTVDISGAGAVAYVGDPDVKKSISGMGRVRQITDKREVRAQQVPRPVRHVIAVAATPSPARSPAA